MKKPFIYIFLLICSLKSFSLDASQKRHRSSHKKHNNAADPRHHVKGKKSLQRGREKANYPVELLTLATIVISLGVGVALLKERDKHRTDDLLASVKPDELKANKKALPSKHSKPKKEQAGTSLQEEITVNTKPKEDSPEDQSLDQLRSDSDLEQKETIDLRLSSQTIKQASTSLQEDITVKTKPQEDSLEDQPSAYRGADSEREQKAQESMQKLRLKMKGRTGLKGYNEVVLFEELPDFEPLFSGLAPCVKEYESIRTKEYADALEVIKKLNTLIKEAEKRKNKKNKQKQYIYKMSRKILFDTLIHSLEVARTHKKHIYEDFAQKHYLDTKNSEHLDLIGDYLADSFREKPYSFIKKQMGHIEPQITELEKNNLQKIFMQESELPKELIDIIIDYTYCLDTDKCIGQVLELLNQSQLELLNQLQKEKNNLQKIFMQESVLPQELSDIIIDYIYCEENFFTELIAESFKEKTFLIYVQTCLKICFMMTLMDANGQYDHPLCFYPDQFLPISEESEFNENRHERCHMSGDSNTIDYYVWPVIVEETNKKSLLQKEKIYLVTKKKKKRRG